MRRIAAWVRRPRRSEEKSVAHAALAGAVATILVALLSTGCVRYVRVQPAEIRVDEEVQLRFTDDAAVRLAREFGRITDHIDGRVQPRGPDSLSVSVWIGRDYVGTQFQNVRHTVAVDLREVTELRRRQLSIPRTAIAAAGAVAFFAVLIDRVIFQGDPNPGNDINPPPPPPERTLLRIPIGRTRQ